MVDILQQELFVTYTDNSEFAVTAGGSGLQLTPNDYITRADNYRLLSGGLAEYLQSGAIEEVIVPVVDSDFENNGGYKLTGFVLVKPIQPRNLFFRRGDILWDATEGGTVPSITEVINKNFNANNPVNPPDGGGACITGRDCFNFNGTCVKGACSCRNSHTGTYCQVCWLTLLSFAC